MRQTSKVTEQYVQSIQMERKERAIEKLFLSESELE